MWSRLNENGGTNYYYYYDAITWIAGAAALAWVIWRGLVRYRRARSLMRRPRRTDHRALKRIVKIKNELSSRYLQPGFSRTIHAVGVGKLGNANTYCIQVFISDANDEMWVGAGATPLPSSYRGVSVIAIQIPPAGLLSSDRSSREQYTDGIREPQEVIVGGISGANTNLTGESGTIGYFCTRQSRFQRRKEIHLLSNSHVFADLRKAHVDDNDLIMQPSPGEPGRNRPIGVLVNFSPLKFQADPADAKESNHVDAAIARLWEPHRHDALIPMIGAVQGYVAERDVEIGEPARKFGRTTGYTEGNVFSLYLDIWIRYDRTGQSAFFKNQLLIAPALPAFTEFVSKGDSGSLVVDARQHAIGLIFAGTSALEPTGSPPTNQITPGVDATGDKQQRIEGYGVASPIGEVLKTLKIDLLV